MRVDAARNYGHLLDVADAVIAEQGVNASLRDIARRAGVGLATLLRHFPTREAMLEALLRDNFDRLSARAIELEATGTAAEALTSWLRDFVGCAHKYRGVISVMMSAIDEPDSALHASCVTMRASGSRLLARAQAEGSARPDLDGTDLFALAGSVAWLGEQPSLSPRIEHFLGIVLSAVLLDARTGARSPVHQNDHGPVSHPRAGNRADAV